MHTEDKNNTFFFFLFVYFIRIVSLYFGDAKGHRQNNTRHLLAQITRSHVCSVVKWNLNIVFSGCLIAILTSDPSIWQVMMVALELFGQLHFCQFKLNSKSCAILILLITKKVLQCAFSLVWPQADPWAQHHSIRLMLLMTVLYRPGLIL